MIENLNKEKLYAVADIIEHQPHVNYNNVINPRDELEGFNMNMVRHTCGTPSCIAGFMSDEYLKQIGRVRYDALYYEHTDAGTYDMAADWATDGVHIRDGYTAYGMDGWHNLFEPPRDDTRKNWDDITPAEAAKVIRHLADTGEVDWTIIHPTE